jgi:hypothetical protein
MGYLIGFVPFRCGHLLSSGRVPEPLRLVPAGSQATLYSRRSQVAFAARHFVVVGRMVCSTSLLIGVKTLFYFIDYLIGFVPFRCGRPLSSGSQLSRFGCACRVSSLPLFPKESADLRCKALCGGREDGMFDIHFSRLERNLSTYFVMCVSILCEYECHALALLPILPNINSV